MDAIVGTYRNAGGFTFLSVAAIWKFMVAMYLIFIMGTATHEYAIGRTREFPLAFIMIRVLVVLTLSAFVASWLGVPVTNE